MSASTALNLGCLGSSVVNVPTHSGQKPLLLHGTTRSLPLLALPNRLLKSSPSNCGWQTITPVRTAVAAVESSNPSEKVTQLFSFKWPSCLFLGFNIGLSEQQESESKKYHFLVANAKFMLDEEEHFKELLFERRRMYGEREKEQDFWLVIEPKFLDKFPGITKRLKRPAVALVSTNGPWIT